MSVHHLSGQPDCIPGFDRRIFCHDVRHKIIGILFYDASNDRKSPQKLKNGNSKHRLGRTEPFFYPKQE